MVCKLYLDKAVKNHLHIFVPCQLVFFLFTLSHWNGYLFNDSWCSPLYGKSPYNTFTFVLQMPTNHQASYRRNERKEEGKDAWVQTQCHRKVRIWKSGSSRSTEKWRLGRKRGEMHAGSWPVWTHTWVSSLETSCRSVWKSGMWADRNSTCHWCITAHSKYRTVILLCSWTWRVRNEERAS